MPQVNYTPIQLYRSGTAGNTPNASLMQNGELAINYADGKLFYKDGAGTVRAMVTPDGSVTTAKIVDANVTTAKIADANVTPAKLSAGAPTWTSGGALTATGKLTVPTGTSVTDLGIQFGSSTTGLWSYDTVTEDGLKVVVNGAVQASFGGMAGYNDIGRSWCITGSTGSSPVASVNWVQARFNLDNDTQPAYVCRAWVNFNGTGTVAIRSSGNVSSITDNGVGDYRVNFSTAMPDTSYSFFGSSRSPIDTTSGYSPGMYPFLSDAKTTTAIRLRSYSTSQIIQDSSECNVAIFR